MASPRVSLIATILNEAGSLPGLLESITRQTLAPVEVIIVDGGSNDGSLAILESWRLQLPLVVVECPGVGIAAGRNIAIERASCDLIAVTDAGTNLQPDWLERIVAPLTRSLEPVDVSSGFFVPSCQSAFETALAASTLPDLDEIDPATFLPSSRSVAFRKSWFDRGHRYPEWLDYCEDLVFDLRLKEAGARLAFQPGAIVRFRPRPDIASFWRQYYNYARGDGKAGLFWRRHAIRYATYLLILPSVFVIRSPIWRILVFCGALLYLRAPSRRIRRREQPPPGRFLALITLAAFLRAVGDVAKMVGYPVGLLWRLRRYGLSRNWRSIEG